MQNTVMIRAHWIQNVIATPVKNYTKAYLYHLDKCCEILGARLNTIHNLRYYQRLMAEIRQAIEDDRFDDFVVEFYARMGKPVPPLQLADKS